MREPLGSKLPSNSKLRLPTCRAAQAEAARRSVAAAVAVSKSDHLAVVAAYNSWRAVLEKVRDGWISVTVCARSLTQLSLQAHIAMGLYLSQLQNVQAMCCCNPVCNRRRGARRRTNSAAARSCLTKRWR